MLNLLVDQAWSRCESLAGASLTEDSSASARLAARSPAVGEVGIIHSRDDTVVLIGQKDLLVNSLTADGSPGYTMSLEWYPEMQGDDSLTCTRHREIHFDQPEKYLKSLCTFWSSVFNFDPTVGNAPRCVVAAAHAFGDLSIGR